MHPVPGPRPDDHGSLRVAVLSDHGLVAESVRAALRNQGYDARVVRWPRSPSAVRSRWVRGRLGPGRLPDVAVLLSDLDRPDRVGVAQALVGSVETAWLVLSGSGPEPAWGAVYERGASLVVPTGTGLADVCKLIDGLAAGGALDGTRRRDLIGAWHSAAGRRADLAERLTTLTEREDEVLTLLSRGITVRDIAERSEVAETTVRSQVKAILRKLDVSSQLAAVAAYHEVAVGAYAGYDDRRVSPPTG